MSAMLNESELSEIVLRSGLMLRPRLPTKPTDFAVAEYKGCLYKVRSYKNSEVAQRQFELTNEVRYLFVECYGQIGRYLVLAYIPCSEVMDRENLSACLGLFLATLSTAKRNCSRPNDFETWCDILERKKIFHGRTLEALKVSFSEGLSRNINWGLEYFDLMPRNFILDRQETFLSIDEKHLRVAPRGVSLVRSMLQLSNENFQTLKESYLSKSGFLDVTNEDYFQFLISYYAVYSLAFIVENVPPQAYRKREDFYRLRTLLMHAVGVSRSMLLLEDMPSRLTVLSKRSAWRMFDRTKGMIRRIVGERIWHLLKRYLSK